MVISNLARAHHPVARLKAIHSLRADADALLDHLEREAVLAARSARATWEEIGRAVGLSASAALRKFDPTGRRT